MMRRILVEEMPANVVKRILAQADPATRRMINELLKYPEDSAGGVMTTELMELRPDWTVAQAMAPSARTALTRRPSTTATSPTVTAPSSASSRCAHWSSRRIRRTR